MAVSTTRTTPRLRWDQVDLSLRTEIQLQLGSSVVSWESREEGFSPGLASVCHLDDGRAVFIKAVTSELNEQSRAMALHEIAVNRALPTTLQAPRLITAVEQDRWVGAVFEVVEGQAPGEPWTDPDLDSVLAGIRTIDVDLGRSLPTLRDSHAEQFSGWTHLANQNLGAIELQSIDPWLNPGVVDRLASIESDWFEVCEPTSLVHADLRADNLLFDDQSNVWILDWANAGLGPAWLDVVALAPSITMQNGRQPWEVWQRFVEPARPEVNAPTARNSRASELGVGATTNARGTRAEIDNEQSDVGCDESERHESERHESVGNESVGNESALFDSAAVDVGVVAIAGYFTFQARQPPVPVIPMLRDFQEAQAKPARAWVQQRLGDVL